ncbi:DedA family protein [Nesterenkonia lacusekhoensis]|uniref:Membrane protein DedA with SNARE-associated domain n=1 Tax=Nesterenkonia lacusekhoensis TaxID=150832 RepID=A0ABS4T205_9MICC|nr:VTT domain-containing protein [Nesterenkonia lacusekhoensis]MBP2317291.1 membrane protein DedA with SNARE-associated domain [Nesterenkonia lacusekhoensis]
MHELGDASLYETWGFWYFLVQAVAVALTAFVPPFPSEVMVIASGTMAADGIMPLSMALTVTFLGCLLGDLGVYALFRYQFIRVLYRWRWGRLLHRKMLRVSIRAGGASTWVGLLLIRGIPGGRSASMATAGMMRLRRGGLIPLALAGAATWTLWLVGLGYITGTTTGLPPWASTAAAVVVGTLVGLIIAMIVARARRRRPPHRSAEGA